MQIKGPVVYSFGSPSQPVPAANPKMSSSPGNDPTYDQLKRGPMGTVVVPTAPFDLVSPNLAPDFDDEPQTPSEAGFPPAYSSHTVQNIPTQPSSNKLPRLDVNRLREASRKDVKDVRFNPQALIRSEVCMAITLFAYILFLN